MPATIDGANARLVYPCPWAYTVVGRDEEAVGRAISAVVQDRKHEISAPRRSAEGNYCAVTLRVTVFDEEDRTSIYEALRLHEDTIIVL